VRDLEEKSMYDQLYAYDVGAARHRELLAVAQRERRRSAARPPAVGSPAVGSPAVGAPARRGRLRVLPSVGHLLWSLPARLGLVSRLGLVARVGHPEPLATAAGRRVAAALPDAACADCGSRPAVDGACR
jgi:hypothetical protein